MSYVQMPHVQPVLGLKSLIFKILTIAVFAIASAPAYLMLTDDIAGQETFALVAASTSVSDREPLN